MASSCSNTLARPRALHPSVVHVPIGGILIAAVCDVVSTAGDSSHSWAQTWFKGGSYALIVGTAVLLIAVLTGIFDRARQTRAGSADRSAVNVHAAVMLVVGVVSIVDLVLRNNHYKNAAHTPAAVLILTLVALGLVLIGGEIGAGWCTGDGSASQRRVRAANLVMRMRRPASLETHSAWGPPLSRRAASGAGCDRCAESPADPADVLL